MTLTYSGTATLTDARIYGQIVDDSSGKVLGNLVTPIPVTLDGQEHTVTRPLEIVAHTLHAGQTLTLQLVANTTAYFEQRAEGAVTVSKADVSLPLVTPGVAQDSGAGVLGAKQSNRAGSLQIRAARLKGRTLRVRVSGRARSVAIVVRDRGGRAIGRKRIGTLAGTKTVGVRLRRRASRFQVIVSGRAANGRPLRASVSKSARL